MPWSQSPPATPQPSPPGGTASSGPSFRPTVTRSRCPRWRVPWPGVGSSCPSATRQRDASSLGPGALCSSSRRRAAAASGSRRCRLPPDRLQRRPPARGDRLPHSALGLAGLRLSHQFESFHPGNCLTFLTRDTRAVDEAKCSCRVEFPNGLADGYLIAPYNSPVGWDEGNDTAKVDVLRVSDPEVYLEIAGRFRLSIC